MTSASGKSGTLALFGASNQVGRALLKQLAGAWHIHAWSRSGAPANLNDVLWHQEALPGPISLPAALDVLIYSAPMRYLPQLLQRLPQLKCLVLVSSMSVTAKQRSPSTKERALAAALRAGEDCAETWGQRTDTRVVIVRPTMIHGYGMDQNLHRIRQFVRRFRFFPLPPPPYGLRQPIHADEVAAIIVRAISRESTRGVLEAGGSCRMSYDEMVARVFKEEGVTPRIVVLPRPLLKVLIGLRGGDPAVVDRIAQDQIAKRQELFS